MIFYFSPNRKTSKRQTSVNEDIDTVNPYILLLTMLMDTNIMKNSMMALKNLGMDPASPTLVIYFKKIKLVSWKQ